MVDTYAHSHEVVIGSVHSGAFTCTLDDMLTCTSGVSGVVCDQPIIPPASSAEENVNFTGEINIESFHEPGIHLTAITF